MNQYKDLVKSILYELKSEIEDISDFIFNHPEAGDEEYLSSLYLTDILKRYGFKITYPYMGISTAFRAEFGDEGTALAFLAEYDALPGYGSEGKFAHACGHNWIAAVSTGTALVLSKLKNNFKGKIVVIGTPAEESTGRKIDLSERGAFDDIDSVFQMHLYENTNLKARALAMDSWEFRFTGKSSHSAAYPHEGINALDAVTLTFAGINAIRQQLRDDVRISGVINSGGEAPNIITPKASCRFHVRSAKRKYLDTVSEKVKNCALGASIMTGATLEVVKFENSYDDLVLNPVLVELMKNNMIEAGFDDICEESEVPGSTDIGNVSYKAPTFYGNVGIAEGIARVHEEAFLDWANSFEAKEKLLKSITSLVYTSIDIYNNDDLLSKIKAEFENMVK